MTTMTTIKFDPENYKKLKLDEISGYPAGYEPMTKMLDEAKDLYDRTYILAMKELETAIGKDEQMMSNRILHRMIYGPCRDNVMGAYKNMLHYAAMEMGYEVEEKEIKEGSPATEFTVYLQKK